MDELARFLSKFPPFDALDEHELGQLAAAAVVVDQVAGEEVLDAFLAPSQEMFVVLAGRVGLWTLPAPGGEPDEILDAGGVFGFSALLRGEAVGPLAVALGPVRLARIPSAAVSPVFSSAAGLRFLARNMASVDDGSSRGRLGPPTGLSIN